MDPVWLRRQTVTAVIQALCGPAGTWHVMEVNDFGHGTDIALLAGTMGPGRIVRIRVAVEEEEER